MVSASHQQIILMLHLGYGNKYIKRQNQRWLQQATAEPQTLSGRQIYKPAPRGFHSWLPMMNLHWRRPKLMSSVELIWGLVTLPLGKVAEWSERLRLLLVLSFPLLQCSWTASCGVNGGGSACWPCDRHSQHSRYWKISEFGEVTFWDYNFQQPSWIIESS